MTLGFFAKVLSQGSPLNGILSMEICITAKLVYAFLNGRGLLPAMPQTDCRQSPSEGSRPIDRVAPQLYEQDKLSELCGCRRHGRAPIRRRACGVQGSTCSV